MKEENLLFIIIDDSMEDREFNKRLLKKIYKNAAFKEAEYGEEGLAILKDNPHVSCVLLDYRLPDLSGLEFLQNLKNSPTHFINYPIIALTGQGDELIASEFIKAGAKDYLVKNKITEEGIHRAVSNAIEKSKLEALIQEKQQEQYNFSHIVAHDLKAPLQRIIAYSDLLEGLLKESDLKQKKYIHKIKNASLYSVEFINTLLTYSEIGRSKVELSPVNLEEPVKNALTNLEMTIKEKNAIVENTMLPTIKGDPMALTQLFQNLISNALKFQQQDTPFVKIYSENHDKKFYRVAIEDKGIGIPPEKQTEIFKPFYRLHNKNDFPGSGIGLATCSTIVEQHNGKIWVESQPGQGSTFYILFPALR